MKLFSVFSGCFRLFSVVLLLSVVFGIHKDPPYIIWAYPPATTASVQPTDYRSKNMHRKMSMLKLQYSAHSPFKISGTQLFWIGVGFKSPTALH